MKIAQGFLHSEDVDLKNLYRNIMRILEKGGTSEYISDQIIIGVQIEIATAVNKKFEKEENDLEMD